MSDWRENKVCPKCGAICVYDGWDHVHSYGGIGIGSCTDIAEPTQLDDEEEHGPDLPPADIDVFGYRRT